MIRAVNSNDIEAITQIYNYYVLNTIVTFETEPVSVQEVKVRVAGTAADFLPWLVAEDDDDNIVGISLPNPASIALHEKFAMKKVAHFEQAGRKFDHWVDVGYWQCLIPS
ncbi:GNAT family N-acetyltransferase [Thalassotalea sp. ND16A]|uniref:GNAT family N-acetyltransferase n=1 Tax=Thalassotalea sp. ND16A TaxID=1535422 RepID=UPI00051A706F|nr:GNAT family N-acetyltransferase [Thalassotalea sp. ND16A]KGK00386.1 hypothetical protein ND16A_3593 [Thalassotalea sp. ND16A]